MKIKEEDKEIIFNHAIKSLEKNAFISGYMKICNLCGIPEYLEIRKHADFHDTAIFCHTISKNDRIGEYNMYAFSINGFWIFKTIKIYLIDRRMDFSTRFYKWERNFIHGEIKVSQFDVNRKKFNKLFNIIKRVLHNSKYHINIDNE